MKGSNVLVTGGAGFLGSHFVWHALAKGAKSVINVDLLTYAGDPRRLSDLRADTRHLLVKADVSSAEEMDRVFQETEPRVVVHYAAESHVTRSESVPDLFYRTNVEGTRVLLDASVLHGVSRFIHISTDEVYGPIIEGYYREDDKLRGDRQASSAYAKSKALADDLALSYADRIEVVIARPTNAFGPYQFPEKAFPRWVTRALRGESLPVWGDGLYVRQWLYAEDFAEAIALLVKDGVPGDVYNVGPRHEPEITNLDLARWTARYLGLPKERVELTAYDRPDHDRRYGIDASKIEALGWRPGDVWNQFARTIDWYSSNSDWWETHIVEAESIYTDVVPK